jgi:rhodanese-related sulfurtransferase
MGWRDVFVLDARASAYRETGKSPAALIGTPSDRSVDATALIAAENVTVIDLSPSPHYRRGHIPRAWFAIRSRLDRALAHIAPTKGNVVLTSDDGALASLAVADAQSFTARPVQWLKGGNAAWKAAGFPMSTAERESDEFMADEPVDVWLKPYERPSDNEAAMNAYLSWEVDLLDRIKQDGTTRFLHAM